jgi:NAD(P)-dependent dehydrogenase (short-subunit alcohol dehydrogenase family)
MPSKSHTETWLVTGSSSGLGRALCEQLLLSGRRVICSARNPDDVSALVNAYPDRAFALQLDVSDPQGVQRAVTDAIASHGAIDVLVNNAGFGHFGALEEITEPEVNVAFDVNVFGPYRVMRAILPHFRARGTGLVLNVSSMMGFIGAAGFGLYCATKFALDGWSEAMSLELKPFGIRVVALEPGPFRTEFRGRSLRMSAPHPAYAETTGLMRDNVLKGHGQQPGDPVKAAQFIIAVSEDSNPPIRVPIGPVAIEAFRNKLARFQDDIAMWDERAAATHF